MAQKVPFSHLRLRLLFHLCLLWRLDALHPLHVVGFLQCLKPKENASSFWLLLSLCLSW
jgi:hypothetical protein